VATARADHDRRDGERVERDPELNAEGTEDTPDPIEHATPDVELAEAQLGRRRPAGDEAEAEVEAEAGALAPAPSRSAAEREHHANRLINFLQGSWRELQRVQWPDRRQVMQATGVVVGFVIVAGLYLGLADWVAGRVVNLILK
jgi:preprotein translocase SecE subunit